VLKKLDLLGNSYIGVFCRASDTLAMVPPNQPEEWLKEFREAVEVPVISLTVEGSQILGTLTCLNSRGAVVADLGATDEMPELREHVDILKIGDKHNAAGNNILCNDSKALVNPDIKKKSLANIADVLGVEAEYGTIAGVKTVGTAAVATNKGVLCHPQTTEEEMAFLKEFFGLPVAIGSANYGTGLVGACMTANSNGAVVGELTTGVELNRIEDTLGYI